MTEHVKDRIILLLERDSVGHTINELTNAHVMGSTSRALPPQHVLEIYTKRKPLLEASGQLLGGLADEGAGVIIAQLSSDERSFLFLLTDDEETLVCSVALNRR